MNDRESGREGTTFSATAQDGAGSVRLSETSQDGSGYPGVPPRPLHEIDGVAGNPNRVRSRLDGPSPSERAEIRRATEALFDARTEELGAGADGLDGIAAGLRSGSRQGVVTGPEPLPEPVPDQPDHEAEIRQMIISSSGQILAKMVEGVTTPGQNPVRMLRLTESFASAMREVIADMGPNPEDDQGGEDGDGGMMFGPAVKKGRGRRRRNRLAHQGGYVEMAQGQAFAARDPATAMAEILPALNDNNRAQEIKNLIDAAEGAKRLGEGPLYGELMDRVSSLTGKTSNENNEGEGEVLDGE